METHCKKQKILIFQFVHKYRSKKSKKVCSYVYFGSNQFELHRKNNDATSKNTIQKNSTFLEQFSYDCKIFSFCCGTKILFRPQFLMFKGWMHIIRNFQKKEN
ncbi:hypothetical protein EDEG_01395 [Edhazardia aedis USNM 41457]|uniref:Uncharacterized protein n=1 Tax=Edhazardia aedis (strain USNM 41457) TaxID=1003232 RepID=J9D990_EDHAE|nr:hypothetical protein EDEG_01395 [Edhazardia aedis USNM 41457]|eukprot:EJW04346.1 hypothetical protein EDEG_01395 [Edhazardia aedis USNM 41457]